MKRITLSLAVLTLITIPTFGATATASLNVSASVSAVCTISTAPVAFGAYDPVVANAATDLSGTDFLNYALYKDAARTQVWGTGMAGGTTLTYNSASKASTAVTVYGKIPQAQDVTVGSYADVVVATINY